MANRKIILIVEDDGAACDELRELIENVAPGMEVFSAYNGAEARKLMAENDLTIALLDYKLPDTTGLELLKEIKAKNVETPVILITGAGSIESGVEAMKEGAHDYILKPFSPEKIEALVRRLLAYREPVIEDAALREELGVRYSLNRPIGKSKKIRKIYDLLPDLCRTDASVLIRGESGTGKELLAKSIHYNSPRKDRPFIVADCTALSETLLESELFGHEKGAFTGAFRQKFGRFEQAIGGTVFLDEIGAFSASAQLKLLRVLQEKRIERVGGEETIGVDIRIIAATNQNLEKLMKDGGFREDLYYRINVIQVSMPPLREREEDVPLLARYFLEEISKKNKKRIKGFDSNSFRILIDYRWPGNIRELENVIERAVVVAKGNMITACDLPSSIQKVKLSPEEGSLHLREQEKNLIEKALFESGYNISRAAKELGITRSTIYSKIKKLKIELE